MDEKIQTFWAVFKIQNNWWSKLEKKKKSILKIRPNIQQARKEKKIIKESFEQVSKFQMMMEEPL